MAANLKGILPDRAVQAIDAIHNTLDSLQSRFNTLSQKPLLTKPEAEQAFGAATMAKELSVSGSNPLNVTNLLGTSQGFSGTFTVRNAAGTGISTFVFKNGLLVSFTP
jgi:hypothetical protein